MNIGVVVEETNTEELVTQLIEELRSQKPLHRVHRRLIREIESRMCGESYHEDGDDQTDIDDLMEALSEYAPPYFRFRKERWSYGYFLSSSFDEEFDGLHVTDLSAVPRGYVGEVVVVNDHGNMTLYAYSRRRKRELWAIV